LLLAIYVLTKRPITDAMKFFSLFGFTTTVWEFTMFLSMSAGSVEMASVFFMFVNLTSQLAMALYFLTVVNIRERRNLRTNVLLFLPAAVQAFIIPTVFFESYAFESSIYGWSYRIKSFSAPFVLVGTIFVVYVAAIVGFLLSLLLRTSSEVLKRKYTILFLGFFVFQVIGTTLTNALITFGAMPADARIGGVLQFLTFVSIGYALQLQGRGILTAFVGTGFQQAYSSFLTEYLGRVGSQLGERYVEFRDFIVHAGIEGRVLESGTKVSLRDIGPMNPGDLVRMNLVFFQEHSTEDFIVDRYLRVLNAARIAIGRDFDDLVREHMSFLRKSDLLYGIAGGLFIDQSLPDKSLAGVSDYEASLKLYKRILLPTVGRLEAADRLRQRLEEHGLSKAIFISDYGEISMTKTRDWLLRIPRERQLEYTVSRFNAYLGWLFEDVLEKNEYSVEELIGKLSVVLKLNQERAVSLGIYQSLLAMLATRIPKAQIHELYRDYLQELVDERTAELKEAQESLVKTQRLVAIGQAAAMVGHDLRNPLQAIVNKLYIAELKLENYGDEELKSLIRTIEEEVEYMNKIVSDLQDYARPISLKKEPVSLNRLFNEVLASLRIPVATLVSIEIDENVAELEMDAALMKRVLTNLITNAVQAMPTGGNLRIAASREDSSALIGITDTGIGIPKENLERLFQAFFTTKSKGQGLGLAVCKRLVEAHEGSISVESTVGQGTTFTIRMPYPTGEERSDRVPLLQPEPVVVSPKHS